MGEMPPAVADQGNQHVASEETRLASSFPATGLNSVDTRVHVTMTHHRPKP